MTLNLVGEVTSFNSRTGDVVPESTDYPVILTKVISYTFVSDVNALNAAFELGDMPDGTIHNIEFYSPNWNASEGGDFSLGYKRSGVSDADAYLASLDFPSTPWRKNIEGAGNAFMNMAYTEAADKLIAKVTTETTNMSGVKLIAIVSYLE